MSAERTDLLWQQYREALEGLSDLPQVLARRHLEVGIREDSDLAACRKDRDEQLAQSQQWRRLAERALSNAQARFVAAQVLIPDVSTSKSTTSRASTANLAEQAPRLGDTPVELVNRLHQAVTDIDSDVAAVRGARRRVVDERAHGELVQLDWARRRRRLRSVALAAVAALLLILAIWLI